MPQSFSNASSLTRLTTILKPFHSGALTPAISMSAQPGRLTPGTATIATFTGVKTHWLTSPPSLLGSGVAGVNNDSPVVIDNTHFTVRVITGAATGTITWTDSTYSITATQRVSRRKPLWGFTKRYH